MSLLALAWMAELGLVSFRTVKNGRPAAAGGYHVPWPADFVASFVVFGSLSVLAELQGGWDKVAAAAGWGFVLATVLYLVDPTHPVHKPTAPGVKPGTTPTQAASSAPGVPNPLATSLGGTP